MRVYDCPPLCSLTAVMEDLFNYEHPITKKPSPKISKETYDIIMKNADVSQGSRS